MAGAISFRLLILVSPLGGHMVRIVWVLFTKYMVERTTVAASYFTRLCLQKKQISKNNALVSLEGWHCIAKS
jgi:hypothetical protein